MEIADGFVVYFGADYFLNKNNKKEKGKDNAFVFKSEELAKEGLREWIRE